MHARHCGVLGWPPVQYGQLCNVASCAIWSSCNMARCARATLWCIGTTFRTCESTLISATRLRSAHRRICKYRAHINTAHLLIPHNSYFGVAANVWPANDPWNDAANGRSNAPANLPSNMPSNVPSKGPLNCPLNKTLKCAIEFSIKCAIERCIEYAIERAIERAIECSIGCSIECSIRSYWHRGASVGR